MWARVSDESRGDRIFYAIMSLTIIVTVFVGFAPTYYLKGYFHSAPLPPLAHIHGFIFTGWILLFVTQTVLIAERRIDIHRRLGIAGSVWAAVLVVVGLATAIMAARRNFAAGNEGALKFLVIPLGDMLVFGVLVAAGIRNRRHGETHKRLMLLATTSILGAALARWPLAIMETGPVAFFGAADLFVVAGLVHDWMSRRTPHPAYVWGGLLILASQALRVAAADTEPWLAFARVLVG